MKLQTAIYKSVGGLQIRADVHLPDGDGPHPTIVFVHGGALIRAAVRGSSRSSAIGTSKTGLQSSRSTIDWRRKPSCRRSPRTWTTRLSGFAAKAASDINSIPIAWRSWVSLAAAISPCWRVSASGRGHERSCRSTATAISPANGSVVRIRSTASNRSSRSPTRTWLSVQTRFRPFRSPRTRAADGTTATVASRACGNRPWSVGRPPMRQGCSRGIALSSMSQATTRQPPPPR